MHVHLTFDDGAGAATDAILDLLQAHDIRATFFVIGRNVEEAQWCGGDRAFARRVIQRTIRQGHEIGNHTFSHDGAQFGPAFIADLEKCDETIHALYSEVGESRKSPIRVRLPYGVQIYREAVASTQILDPRLSLLASAGRAHFHWTSLFDDWESGISAEQIAAGMISHIQLMMDRQISPVLVLHDGSELPDCDRRATVAALERLLGYAKQQGWTFLEPPT